MNVFLVLPVLLGSNSFLIALLKLWKKPKISFKWCGAMQADGIHLLLIKAFSDVLYEFELVLFIYFGLFALSAGVSRPRRLTSQKKKKKKNKYAHKLDM